MNIAHYEESSQIYGPGDRFVIWTQGCSLHCPGCWNQDMWSFEKKNEISKEKLWQIILGIKNDIEGVTFLGGEPFEQYADLLWLAQKIFVESLSLMIFTGYDKEELVQDGKSEIFQYTDILIDGRYIAPLRNVDLQWRGSSNQTIHFLSPRYTPAIIHNSNYMEFLIDEWGQTTVLGFPNAKILKACTLDSLIF